MQQPPTATTEKNVLERLKKYRTEYQGSIEVNSASFKLQVDVLCELIETVGDAKVEVPQWEDFSKTLVEKIVFSSLSIHKLSQGIIIDFYKRKKQSPTIDCTSMMILARSIIEAYVILCYIYNNKLKQEEKFFRFKIWEYAGLVARQNLPVGNSAYNAEMKNKEKDVMQRIFTELNSMEEFKNLDKGTLKKINSKYGLSKLYTFHELIKQSNLKDIMYLPTYNYYSQYAHAEFSCIKQLKSNAHPDNHQIYTDRIKIVLLLTRIVVALCSDFYINKYKSAELIYNSFPKDVRHSVELWRDLGGTKI